MVCYLKDLCNKKPPEGGLFEFLATYTAVNCNDLKFKSTYTFLATYTAVNKFAGLLRMA